MPPPLNAEIRSQPGLAPAFAQLDRWGVRWAQLRAEDPDEPFVEVDLLVAPADLSLAGRALAEAGFIAWPGGGLGSHRFFLSYDGTSGQWRKVDVVTDLAFGRRRHLPVAGAEAVLARRVRTGSGWALAPGDDFWALAFHCLLDRRSLPPRHRDRLVQLAPDAARSPLGGWLAGRRLRDRIVTAAAAGDSSGLGACATSLRRALIRARPAAATLRLGADTVRTLGAKLTLPTRPALLVALLGPDGSGKSTLAGGLCSALPLRTRLLYGGLYADGQRSLGRLGHLLGFAVAARYEVRRGGIVLADRHPLENSGHKGGIRAALRRRLFRAAPVPDLTILLDCDGGTMFGRKGEHGPEQLEDQRRRLRKLADQLPHPTMLDALQPPLAVRAGASQAIWEQFRRRS